MRQTPENTVQMRRILRVLDLVLPRGLLLML
jgi:hypothetical protein